MSLTPKVVNFKEKWAVLQRTLEKLITLRKVSRAVWNDHFSDVYDLCVANPQPFADRLYSEIKKFLLSHVEKLLAKVLKSSRDEMVMVYFKTWMEYSVGVRHIHCLFLYLNMHYVRAQNDPDFTIIYDDISKCKTQCMVIGELGLSIWKDTVIIALKGAFIDLLLDGIMSFKVPCVDDSSNECIYKGCVESFILVEDYKKKDPLKFYEEILEGPYLKRCGKHYQLESAFLSQECDVNSYLVNVWRLFEEEKQRCIKFLHGNSLLKVEAQFVKYMVADHLAFLHEECHSMVQQEQFGKLKMMYLLLRLVDNGLGPLASEMLEHIKEKGLQVISALPGENNCIQFVESCLNLHEKYSGIISNFFENDKCLLSVLDKACSFIINKKQVPGQTCQSPEILAKYCDVLLKKSCKGLLDVELEVKLTKCIVVFRYIDEKDVFQKCYSRMLAKRLILRLSNSLDVEEFMINKLKQACGYEFTNKLHRMLTDIKISSDLNFDYSKFLREKEIDLGISFFIHVLQVASWPLCPSILNVVSLPHQLETAMQMFKSFYYDRFNCRKLTFVHHHCQVEVKLHYLKKQYLIVMQTFQMILLLQFEKLDQLSYSELQEATQLTGEQLIKLINSLMDSKLITCNDSVPGELSVFLLNLTYTNKRTKFRIAAASHQEAVREAEQTRSSVEEDRKFYLHAVIVRIMKNRKVLHHNILVQEILSLCREKFTPTVSTIKKAIESLIEKQYIERSPNATNEYSYVA